MCRGNGAKRNLGKMEHISDISKFEFHQISPNIESTSLTPSQNTISQNTFVLSSDISVVFWNEI